ncbi:PEP-CTERM sorting domain-containing protein [Verrucomicrobiaceae bacterium 227]
MKRSISTLMATTALSLTAQGAVITGSVSTFTGPDDLLLDPATNVIAVDIGGDTGSPVVNGITFQSDGTGITGTASAGGVSVSSSATHSINGWTDAPNYTGTDPVSASNLGAIMHDIRWSLNPANIAVDITGLTPGTLYNVQLLFSENGSASDRHWDIGVDGVLAVDDYNTNGTSASIGSVYSGNFDPGADGTLNILMGQEPLPGDPNNTAAAGQDNNPILNAVIIHQVVPEPGSLALLGLGFISMLARRRR